MENYLTERKNVFEGLISTLDTVEERIQDKSREITQTETQIENEWKKKLKEQAIQRPQDSIIYA